MESEYSKFFDQVCEDMNQDLGSITEHSLCSIFWDEQQKKIDDLTSIIRRIPVCECSSWASVGMATDSTHHKSCKRYTYKVR
jgi:hypothetical protein